MWHDISGGELESVATPADLEGLLPDTQAIYMWRRYFRPPKGPVQFRDWLDHELRLPTGVVLEETIGHFLKFGSIRVGGIRGLTAKKQVVLQKLVGIESQRKLIREFVKSLNEFAPILYTGETDDLRRRTIAHIRGGTDFGASVTDVLGLSWSQVRLHYMALSPAQVEPDDSDANRRRRTLLEEVASLMTISPSIKRVG